MSTLIAGQPFIEPVAQTILPVAELSVAPARGRRPATASARIVGFFPIAETVFTGSETSFALATGEVNITSLRLPPQVSEDRAPEYMVAYYNATEARTEQWRGHPSFVAAADSGYYAYWIQAQSVTRQMHGQGLLVGSLVQGLDIGTWVPPASPQPPQVEDAALRWAASMSLTDNLDCAFFDFNWIKLFEVQPPAGVDPTKLSGLAILPTEQPPGLPFKSSVLQVASVGYAGQEVFNTVRIIKMKTDIDPGDYVFGFRIVYIGPKGGQGQAEVELTLTVV